jgi:hypothetical protein
VEGVKQYPELGWNCFREDKPSLGSISNKNLSKTAYSTVTASHTNIRNRAYCGEMVIENKVLWYYTEGRDICDENTDELLRKSKR